jgi:hypothetical protein
VCCYFVFYSVFLHLTPCACSDFQSMCVNTFDYLHHLCVVFYFIFKVVVSTLLNLQPRGFYA